MCAVQRGLLVIEPAGATLSNLHAERHDESPLLLRRRLSAPRLMELARVPAKETEPHAAALSISLGLSDPDGPAAGNKPKVPPPSKEDAAAVNLAGRLTARIQCRDWRPSVGREPVAGTETKGADAGAGADAGVGMLESKDMNA